MTMPRVLLDSNVYRGADRARFDALLEAERRRGVARYCEPFVASEFLAHLADPADPDFRSCRRAVVRLYRRCNATAGGECGMLPDSESRLAEFVTGKVLDRHAAYAEQMVLPLVGDIGLTPLDQPLPAGMQPHLRLIAEHMAQMEEGFAGQMRQVQAVVAAVRASGSREEGKESMRLARRTHESAGQRRLFADAVSS
jgi:hypothetical protein